MSFTRLECYILFLFFEPPLRGPSVGLNVDNIKEMSNVTLELWEVGQIPFIFLVCDEKL